MEPRVQETLDRISVPVHSCVRIESRHPGVVMYVDPFRLDGAPHDADIVLITHDHYDHFSPEDIAKVRKPGTAFVLPQAMDRRDLPLDRTATEVHFLAPYSECTVFGIPVRTVPAYNVGKEFHPKANRWIGYVLTVDGVRVYVSGDTDDNQDVRTVRCDIACLAAGGTFTCTPREAAELACALAPAVAIPTHYGSVVGKPEDGAAFKEFVGGRVPVCLKIPA